MANKTATFLQDILYQNIIKSNERVQPLEKQPYQQQIPNESKIDQESEEELRLKNVISVGSKMHRSSSEESFIEQTQSSYLLQPDKWADKIINSSECNQQQSQEDQKILLEIVLTEAEAEADGITDPFTSELNEFLSSYCPRIKSDETYNKILSILENTSAKQEAVKIFLIHQFRTDTEETRNIICKYDVEISENQLMDCLFRPFSAKSLKNEYEYLVLKIRDYSKFTIFNLKFVSIYLDKETKQKDFTNRCFFSNIEKLFGKMDEINQKYKDLFYLLFIKVLPKMSDKQQKNLNKLMSKNDEIPEGVKRFLKKQMKLLKEQEFEMLKEQFNKLVILAKEYDNKLLSEGQQKMATDKVKEFCGSLNLVIPIVRSNQKYWVDLGESMQGWIHTEYHWVKILLCLPRINKLPKANLEQIKQSFKHIKELSGTQMKKELVEYMNKFIEEWGLKKNQDWTKLIQ